MCEPRHWSSKYSQQQDEFNLQQNLSCDYKDLFLVGLFLVGRNTKSHINSQHKSPHEITAQSMSILPKFEQKHMAFMTNRLWVERIDHDLLNACVENTSIGNGNHNGTVINTSSNRVGALSNKKMKQ